MSASLYIDPNPQLVAAAVPGTAVLATTLHIAAAPLLGIALLSGLVEAHESWPAAKKLMQPLANLGRLSLTVYLSQSLIGTWLFYGYGFGLWGQVGRAGQVVLCVLVLAIQLRLARWYVARFAYGPVEWLWRWGTNGQIPQMLRVHKMPIKAAPFKTRTAYRSMAVSYTHLDVYKKQAHRRLGKYGRREKQCGRPTRLSGKHRQTQQQSSKPASKRAVDQHAREEPSNQHAALGDHPAAYGN